LESRKERRLVAARHLQTLVFLLLGAAVHPAIAQQALPSNNALQSIELHEPGGQILSYRYQASATEVKLQGTRLAPNARIKAKIGSRPGFVELDINRGEISGLEPAPRFGKDFLTYVLWAVSVDGRAANLGEITFNGRSPVSINVTTPYQTFWLMVTAEPDYAVADPSPIVVLYSIDQSDTLAERRAQRITGNLFYYTHYTAYDTSPGKPASGPNELLQARKALELASRAGIPAAERRARSNSREEDRTGNTLALAKKYMEEAEAAYAKDPKGGDVVQISRTAAQIAENGRALALGAVGDIAMRRLAAELQALRSEMNNLEPGRLETSATPTPESTALTSVPAGGMLSSKQEPAAAAFPFSGIAATVKNLASQPITWFGVAGWVVVVLLLFRRPSV